MNGAKSPDERISPYLEQAILAAEDDGFYQHVGLSIPRIIVTLVKDIIQRRMHGASTLTQQLTRKLFLTDDKTPERKIKEAILAIQIEKRYTKREIFTLYCNQMYFGHGVYGVEAASRLYFGKSAKDVSIEEAALIAGILQANVRQSPYVNREAALRRRNYALGRMAEVGYITAGQAEELKKKPIVVRADPPGQTSSAAPYSSRKCAASSRAGTAPSSSTRTACRFRQRSICGCRKPRRRRSMMACDGSTSGAASASPGAM